MRKGCDAHHACHSAAHAQEQHPEHTRPHQRHSERVRPVDLVQREAGRDGRSNRCLLNAQQHERAEQEIEQALKAAREGLIQPLDDYMPSDAGYFPTALEAMATEEGLWAFPYVAKAEQNIVMGKSFDNGVICGSENNLIAVSSIYDEFIKQLETPGVVPFRELRPYQ